MDKTRLQQQAFFMRSSLFEQGYLDEQFIQLEELQDDVNPNFVEEIVILFYSDSVRLVSKIEQALMSKPTNFAKLEDYMHQFKGSCSSERIVLLAKHFNAQVRTFRRRATEQGIGAKKVKNDCNIFNEYCAAENSEGCFRTFQQIKQEYTTLKKKLETYFQLAREAAHTK